MSALFDDDYPGPRWTYGLTYRHATLGAVPRGAILLSERQHPDYRHGTVDYPRPLTAEECRAFDLTPVAAPPAR